MLRELREQSNKAQSVVKVTQSVHESRIAIFNNGGQGVLGGLGKMLLC